MRLPRPAVQKEHLIQIELEDDQRVERYKLIAFPDQVNLLRSGKVYRVVLGKGGLHATGGLTLKIETINLPTADGVSPDLPNVDEAPSSERVKSLENLAHRSDQGSAEAIVKIAWPLPGRAVPELHVSIADKVVEKFGKPDDRSRAAMKA